MTSTGAPVSGVTSMTTKQLPGQLELPLDWASLKVPLKHQWRLDSGGEVDIWRYEADYHNGPQCVICDDMVCIHCKPGWADLDDCPGRYYL